MAGSDVQLSFRLTFVIPVVKAYPVSHRIYHWGLKRAGKLFAVNHKSQEIIMADEITIKPKSESTPATAAPQNQTVSLGRAQIVNLCAAGLGVSFFLPWANIFGANVSGFDLQKAGDEQRLLWAIPIFCLITIFAGVTKRSQQIAGQLSGALPFVVGVYWYMKLGKDMFQILTFGAYLSLAFGLVLLILARKTK